MYYPDYLIHYNKNHSAKNGQFTSGDGDGDGISNDHAHRSKKSAGNNLKSTIKANKKKKSLGAGLLVSGTVGTGLSAALASYGAETDHPIATVAGLIGSVVNVGAAVVGGIISDQAYSAVNKATREVIDEHYDAPLSEAYDFLRN